MDFVSAHHAKMQASQPKPIIEFPKFVKVDGKDVLALDAAHEAELLGLPEGVEEDPTPVTNLLSAPDKRKPGRPRLINSDKD